MICATLVTACGTTDNTDQNKGNTDTLQSESTENDDTSDGDTVSIDEMAAKSFTLNLEFADEDTLPTPENTQLFSNNLSLPINFNDLLSYKVKSHDDNSTPVSLAEYMQMYNESAYNKIGYIYPEDVSTIASDQYSSTAYLTLGENTSSSIDRNKYPTLQSFVDSDLWYIEERLEAEMFGMTDEELTKAAVDYDKYDGYDTVHAREPQLLLDKLVEKLGKPNYFNTGLSNNIDTDYVKMHFLTPEDNDSYGVGVNLCYVGWIYSDFSVMVSYGETTQTTSEGEFMNHMDLDDIDYGVYYYPYKYTDVYSQRINMRSDFENARNELLNK